MISSQEFIAIPSNIESDLLPPSIDISELTKYLKMKLPRIKIAPKNENYNQILNIGYTTTSSGKRIYSCFMHCCRFKSYNIENFKLHLNRFHNNETLTGFCLICDNFECKLIDDELNHMIEHAEWNKLKISQIQSGERVAADCVKQEEESYNEIEIDNNICEQTNIEEYDDYVKNEPIDESQISKAETTVIESKEQENYKSSNEASKLPNNEQQKAKFDGFSFGEIEITSNTTKNQSSEIPATPKFKMPLNLPETPKSSSSLMYQPKTINFLEISPSVSLSRFNVSDMSLLSDTQSLLEPIETPFKVPEYPVTRKCVQMNATARKRTAQVTVKRAPLANVNDELKHLAEDMMKIKQEKISMDETLLLNYDDENKDRSERAKSCEKKKLRRLNQRAMSLDLRPRTKTIDYNDSIINNTILAEVVNSEKAEDDLKPKKSRRGKWKRIVHSNNSSSSSDTSQKSLNSPAKLQTSSSNTQNTDLNNQQSTSTSETSKNPNSDTQNEKSTDSQQNHNGTIADIDLSVIQKKIVASTKNDDKFKNFKPNESVFGLLNDESAIEESKKQNFSWKSSIHRYFKKSDDEPNAKRIKMQKSPENSADQSSKIQKVAKNLQFSPDNDENVSKSSADHQKSLNSSNDQKSASNSIQLSISQCESLNLSITKPQNDYDIFKIPLVEREHPKFLTKPKNIDMTLNFNDSNASMKFKNISQLYPWIDRDTTKTIFKTKTSIDVLSNKFCQFATYKCMNEICIFFTTDFDEFKKHVESHDANCHYCSYCLKIFENADELCEHIKNSHQFDRFQCNKCMYRSCQKGYVSLHQKKHHENEICEVLKSPVMKLLKKDRDRYFNELSKRRAEFVKQYRCKTPRCKEIFYSKQSYNSHLTNESRKPNLGEFVSIIAEQLILIDHTRTFTNKEGTTQCLFCEFGTDGNDILNHLSEMHPNEFAYVCKRVNNTQLDAKETIDTHTTIEFIGKCSTETKNFDGDCEKLKSLKLENEIKVMSGLLVIKNVESEVIEIGDE